MRCQTKDRNSKQEQYSEVSAENLNDSNEINMEEISEKFVYEFYDVEIKFRLLIEKYPQNELYYRTIFDIFMQVYQDALAIDSPKMPEILMMTNEYFRKLLDGEQKVDINFEKKLKSFFKKENNLDIRLNKNSSCYNSYCSSYYSSDLIHIVDDFENSNENNSNIKLKNNGSYDDSEIVHIVDCESGSENNLFNKLLKKFGYDEDETTKVDDNEEEEDSNRCSNEKQTNNKKVKKKFGSIANCLRQYGSTFGIRSIGSFNSFAVNYESKNSILTKSSNNIDFTENNYDNNQINYNNEININQFMNEISEFNNGTFNKIENDTIKNDGIENNELLNKNDDIEYNELLNKNDDIENNELLNKNDGIEYNELLNKNDDVKNIDAKNNELENECEINKEKDNEIEQIKPEDDEMTDDMIMEEWEKYEFHLKLKRLSNNIQTFATDSSKETITVPNYETIVNALRFNSLSNPKYEKLLDKIIETMKEFKDERIILLMSSESKKFKGIYILTDDGNSAEKLWGNGPNNVQNDDIDILYKYSDSENSFDIISKSFTQTADGFSLVKKLENESW